MIAIGTATDSNVSRSTVVTRHFPALGRIFVAVTARPFTPAGKRDPVLRIVHIPKNDPRTLPISDSTSRHSRSFSMLHPTSNQRSFAIPASIPRAHQTMSLALSAPGGDANGLNVGLQCCPQELFDQIHDLVCTPDSSTVEVPPIYRPPA